MQTRRNNIAPFIFDKAVLFIIMGTVYLVDRVLNDDERHYLNGPQVQIETVEPDKRCCRWSL